MSQGTLANVVRGMGHTLAAFSTNCSEFHRGWTASNEAAAGDELGGRWTGEWVSRANGHRGALKCLLKRLDDSHCRARFHATYASVLRVCYSVVLELTASGDGLRLEGHTDLGKLAGGIYQYEGWTNGRELRCTYRCEYDHGDFFLTRNASPLKAGS